MLQLLKNFQRVGVRHGLASELAQFKECLLRNSQRQPALRAPDQ